MLKDIFGSLGFVIVGSDILFWAYFFIMDKVSVFESSDFGELRIIVDPKGDVWFVASDVAKSLGYINAKDAVKRHVDDDDSMLLQVSDNQWGVKRSILKTRYIDSIRIINESGLYSLILSSKLESAKRFKKWITSEVLPSIRKMDPNLVAALMNGRNNQDGFGGANGWWLWIIVLFWLWGGRGFGNGFGNGGDCCANGLPAQLNNDYGRELLMQAIQGNRSAIDQIASALNCSTTQLQNAICNVQGAIDKVAGQVGMTSQAVINAVQQQGCEIGNQISSCCCNLSSLINQSTCQTQGMITQQGFDNQLRTLEQTNILQNGLNQGLANNREQATSQFNILSAKLDAQTVMINDKFCQLEMREMQNTIAQLREEKAALTASALSQQQTQNIVGQLRPTAVPAYPSCSPYQAYTWGQVFGGGCCNNGCGCNNGCCNNNAAV